MGSFHFKIDGDNVAPETVELGDLLSLLEDLRLAIFASAVAKGQKREDLSLYLTHIEKKCNQLTICESDSSVVGRLDVEAAIRHRDLSSIPRSGQKPLKRIWSRAVKRQWSFSFNGQGEVRAVIDPKLGMPRESVLREETTLYARILKPGGEDPTVQVQMSNGETRTFDCVDKTIAQQLGKKLYRTVALHGTASWYRGTQELKDFKVRKVGAYDDALANPAEAMRELSRIMGHHWKDVDADEYMREERSDD